MSGNLIIFPTKFKGFQECSDRGEDDLINEIRLLCRIPEVYRIFRMQLDSVRECFKEKIGQLQLGQSEAVKDKNEFTTGIPELDDYIRLLCTFPDFRENRLAEIKLIKRFLEKKEA